MFGPLKENTGNVATAECLQWEWALTQRRLLHSHQRHNLMCGWEERLAPPGLGWALTSLGEFSYGLISHGFNFLSNSELAEFTISGQSWLDTSLNIFGIICNQVLLTVSLTVLEVAATQCWMRCWALLSSAGWQWPITTADATTTVYNSFHFQSLTDGWL